MNIKTILTGGAALLLLSVAWKNRDGEWMQSFTSTHRSQAQPAIRFDNDAPDSGAPSAGLSAAQATQTARPVGIRKCRRGDQVICADEACPAGSREHAMSGGAVTVVPAQPSPPTAKLPSVSGTPGSRLPHAKEILLHDDGQARLRDQAMERVINR